ISVRQSYQGGADKVAALCEHIGSRGARRHQWRRLGAGHVLQDGYRDARGQACDRPRRIRAETAACAHPLPTPQADAAQAAHVSQLDDAAAERQTGFRLSISLRLSPANGWRPKTTTPPSGPIVTYGYAYDALNRVQTSQGSAMSPLCTTRPKH